MQIEVSGATGNEAASRVPGAYAAPRLEPWKEWFIRAFALATLGVTAYYLSWRWTSSLNPDAIVFSVALAAAETWGFVTAIFMVFTAWRLKHREPPSPPRGASVDVFITTYDEPLEIIRRTALGARNIRYPHNTYILDDGKRDEIERLAGELGVGYIRREGNEHAKAGNLNHALEVTDGEFILQLDADHVPMANIVHRLLGFFEDPKVAFVQSPQDFYNDDSFTHDVDEQGRRIWEEQRIFFTIIQPGKDRWNAAFFCGSCGIIRRSAFEEIGGFSTETITEDMETSLILHGRGWKSVYYPESLAYGLAPGSAAAFHVQRLRWGQGSLQILRKLNPLTHPGLSIPQRICYLASVTSYFDGLQKIILYLAPLIFLFTGLFPIQADNSEFLVRFIPYLVMSIVMFELLARGTGFLWLAERYNMAKFFTYFRALGGLFAKEKLKFNVTPKTEGAVPFQTYAAQLVLIALSVAAVIWSTLAWQYALVDYQVPGWGSLAFWANFVWVAWNLYLAVWVVRLSLRKRQREKHRFDERVPVRVAGVGKNGEVGSRQVALATDLSPEGVAIHSPAPLRPADRVTIDLPLCTGRVTVSGRVVHTRVISRNGDEPIHAYGVEFDSLTAATRDAIELHCTQHAVPVKRKQYREHLHIGGAFQWWLTGSRSERRVRRKVPARVTIRSRSSAATHDELGLIEDSSPGGARLMMDTPVAPGALIEYQAPGASLGGVGEVVAVRAFETEIGVRFSVGLQHVDEEVSIEEFQGPIEEIEPDNQRKAS
jgi:cellulose synthase (UDP-forming)